MLRRLALMGFIVWLPIPFGVNPPSSPPKAMLVVGTDSLRPSDELLAARLRRRGYEVTVVTSAPAQAANARGANVVVLSPTVPAGRGGRFAASSTPLIALNASQFAALGLTLDRPGDTFGLLPRSESSRVLVAGGQVLAASLEGEVEITRGPAELGWAIPAADAVVVARSVGQAGRAVLFGYDLGAHLVTGPVPARRVGFALSEKAIEALDSPGWSLLLQACDWSAGREITESEENLGTEPSPGTAKDTSSADDDRIRPMTLGPLATPVANPPGGTSVGSVTVTLSSISGATIYWTTQPPPTNPATVYSGPLTFTQNTTIRFYATHPSYDPSPIGSATYAIQLVAPTLNPGSGTYPRGQSVSISTSVSGATLRYTLDGSDPTEADATITSGGTFTFYGPVTLKARAFKTGNDPGVTTTGAYTLSGPTAAAPAFTPPAGTCTTPQAVTLQTTTPGATIRYTLDGSQPTLRSPVYTGPLPLDSTVTVRARAYAPNVLPSTTATAAYIFNTGRTGTPVLNPPSGTYVTGPTVLVSSATPGATIRYTTNGADPTLQDPIVPLPGIPVAGSAVIKAKAWSPSLAESPTGVGVYTSSGAVSAGWYHVLVVNAAGSIWAWGHNASGQLGNGSTTNARSPIPVTGLNDVVAVAAGGVQSLAIKRDRSLWSWGQGTGRLVPGQVTGLSDVVAIAAGWSISLALTSDGRVFSWSTALPARVVGLPGNVIAIAIAKGTPVSFALTADGDVWTWSSGVPRMLDLSGVIQIGTGVEHYLAIKTDGGTTPTLWAWGLNRDGQLGDGTQTDRPAPVLVSGLSGARSAVGSQYHTAALTSDGRVWTWGSFELGEDRPFLPKVPGRLGRPRDAVAVSAGFAFGVVLQRNGILWTWGDNGLGQLGNGSTQGRSDWPVQVAGLAVSDTSGPDGDPDGDGLATWRELELGSDPMNPDTNGDGVRDGAAVAAGLSATNPDMDGDGVSNALELSRGTDPFRADTDGDGVGDATDCFPLDPTRSQCPTPTPGDTTPPTITLTEPTSATLISVIPPP